MCRVGEALGACNFLLRLRDFSDMGVRGSSLGGEFLSDRPMLQMSPSLEELGRLCFETRGRAPHHFLNPVSSVDYTLFNIYSM